MLSIYLLPKMNMMLLGNDLLVKKPLIAAHGSQATYL